MIGRRRGMGVVGVAATAKVVSNRTMAKAEAEQADQAAQQQAMNDAATQAAQQAVAAQQPAAPAAPAADDITAQLEKLATLKTAGVISEEEFAAAKAKLLGI